MLMNLESSYFIGGPFQINILNKQFAIRSIIYVPIFVMDTYSTDTVLAILWPFLWKQTQHNLTILYIKLHPIAKSGWFENGSLLFDSQYQLQYA